MTTLFSRNQLPLCAAPSLSLVRITKGKLETPVKLVLPLLRKAAWADHVAPLQVTARDQFLDEQTGHNGLACTGVVGEQEA